MGNDGRRRLKGLGPCYPAGNLNEGLPSWLQNRHIPVVAGVWGVNQRLEILSLSPCLLSLSFSLSISLPFK